MIIVLAGILIIYGYYEYIYMPIATNIGDIKNKVAQAETTLGEYRLRSIPENRIYQDYEQALGHTIAITHRYYPEMLQEQVILDIQKLIQESGIELASLNFSNPTYVTIAPRIVGDGGGSSLENLARSFLDNNQEEKKIPKDNLQTSEQVRYMSATLNFTGSYDSIKGFINRINENRYRLIINNIMLNTKQEDGLFVGSAVIDVYSIPHVVSDGNAL